MERSLTSVLLVLLILFGGCASREVADRGTEAAEPRYAPVDAVEGLNAFAFDMYRELQGVTLQNTFYSPLSISTALAMTYAGAEGKTAEEMAEVMHYGPQNEAFHREFAAMTDSLRSGSAEDFAMQIANAVWVQKAYELRKAYIRTVKEIYGSKAGELDLQGSPEASAKIINGWVAEHTAGHIRDLVPPPAIGRTSRLILEWYNKFNEKMTEKADFQLQDGSRAETEMMYQRDYFYYSETPAWQVLDMEYTGREYAMTVILPREHDGIRDLAASLDGDLLLHHDSVKTREDVMLYFPKFRLETRYELNGALTALGMREAFLESADFSGMTGGKDLMISSVLHKAFIEVDEKKTEAAAATAVVMKLTSAMPAPETAPVEFRADHPFIFVIRSKKENAILFIGHYTEPKSS
jgi:serpin B